RLAAACTPRARSAPALRLLGVSRPPSPECAPRRGRRGRCVRCSNVSTMTASSGVPFSGAGRSRRRPRPGSGRRIVPLPDFSSTGRQRRPARRAVGAETPKREPRHSWVGYLRSHTAVSRSSAGTARAQPAPPPAARRAPGLVEAVAAIGGEGSDELGEHLVEGGDRQAGHRLEDGGVLAQVLAAEGHDGLGGGSAGAQLSYSRYPLSWRRANDIPPGLPPPARRRGAPGRPGDPSRLHPPRPRL